MHFKIKYWSYMCYRLDISVERSKHALHQKLWLVPAAAAAEKKIYTIMK